VFDQLGGSFELASRGNGDSGERGSIARVVIPAQ
jgi:hypothetical protein